MNKNKSRTLDQFYTNEKVAALCYNVVLDFLKNNNIVFDEWLEPSAGTGAFFNLLPDNKTGIDIEPKNENIKKADFLKYKIPVNKKYITLGNPPFGKNSSLAIKFFNKSSEYSEVIAFIVPKTFKKNSVKNKLNPSFHLCYEMDIPQNSFIMDDKIKDVPCVFQIWKKLSVPRATDIFPETNDFHFTKNKDLADFAIQRVGANAGTLKMNKEDIALTSHYFLCIDSLEKEKVKAILNTIDWNKQKYNTAGNPSISKEELINNYNKLKENFIACHKNILFIRCEDAIDIYIKTENMLIKIRHKNIEFIDKEMRIIIDNNIIMACCPTDYKNLKKILS